MSLAAIRPFLIQAHRWIGIVLTPVFLLVILSGAVLSFRPIVADFTAQSMVTSTVDAQALGALVKQLGAKATIDAVTVVDGGRAVDVASPDAAIAGRWDIASAARGQAPAAGINVFDIAENLHKSLLLGLGIVVEIASWVMLAIMVAGPFLAWLRFRNTLIGWHMALGWCLLPFTILSPLTAVLLTLGVGAGSMPLPTAARPVTISEALVIAAPDVDVSSLIMARRFRGGTVLMQAGGAAGGMFAVTDTNAVALTGGPGIVKEIHEGTWAGAWSGSLNFAVSLALLGLTVTGFWSWFGRYRRDRRGAATAGADILIAYASQTGTAAHLAAATARALEAAGEQTALAPLGAVAPSELGGFRYVLIVASTTGEGDIPDGAMRFVRALQPGGLSGARIAILGLGDRSYARFCGGGDKLRAAMLAAGGEEALPMARADRDPGPAWSAWLANLGAGLDLKVDTGVVPVEGHSVSLRITARHRLDDPTQGDTQETWSVTLESDEDIAFRPGDLLRLAPGKGERERPYSIGSSSLVDPRRIELTVKLHQWNDESGREGFGHMSERLIREVSPDMRLSGRIDPHPGFNPPGDPTWPIIMIGAGSGVAPFPGFLSERRASGRAGPAWLVFGNRHHKGDYLWADRFGAALKDGSLTRLDTAFSRDADDGAHVQARLEEAAEEVFRWLTGKKAVVYICGGREMAHGVETTLALILARYDGTTQVAARAVIDRWIAEQRIRVDAFD